MSINPYEDFLESTREAPIVTLTRHLAKYAMSRTTTTMFAYPWEAMIILRQVQCSEDNARPSTTMANVLKEKTLEERRKEYEEYLLLKTLNHPNGNITTHTDGSIEKPLAIKKDSDGYVDLKKTSIGRIKLDLKSSLLTSLYQCAQLEGLGACWQGSMAWNVRRIVFDLIQDGLLPLILSGKQDHRLAMEVAMSTGTCLILNPIDVIHTRLIIQSPFANEQAYSHGMYSVVKEMKSLRELWCGTFCNVLARAFETVSTLFISRLGCALIDRLGWANYAWISAGYFVVNAVALNAPLLLTMPLDTIRRRAIVPDRLLFTRVPVRPDWPLAEQLSDLSSLYQGYGFRIITNLSLLLINLMGELEGEWLSGSGGVGDDF